MNLASSVQGLRRTRVGLNHMNLSSESQLDQTIVYKYPAPVLFWQAQSSKDAFWPTDSWMMTRDDERSTLP